MNFIFVVPAVVAAISVLFTAFVLFSNLGFTPLPLFILFSMIVSISFFFWFLSRISRRIGLFTGSGRRRHRRGPQGGFLILDDDGSEIEVFDLPPGYNAADFDHDHHDHDHDHNDSSSSYGSDSSSSYGSDSSSSYGSDSSSSSSDSSSSSSSSSD